MQPQQFGDLIGARLALHALNPVFGRPEVGERYQVHRILGSGARGVVCAAEQAGMETPRALKLIPVPDGEQGEDLVDEARSEARVAGILDRHPGVFNAFDIWVEEIAVGRRRVPCVVLPMHLGECNLQQWLVDERPTQSEILDMYARVARVLADVHDRDIVHGDFKPENVIIFEGEPHLADFGMARVGTVDSGVGGSEIVGTLEYMAPEARERVMHPTIDQFSFAVSLWRSLTGVPPFDPYTHPWRAPGRFRFDGSSHLPWGVWRTLSRCLKREPAQRFESMATVVARLEKHARREQRRENRQTAEYRRARARAMVVGAVLAVGVGSYVESRRDFRDVKRVFGFTAAEEAESVRDEAVGAIPPIRQPAAPPRRPSMRATEMAAGALPAVAEPGAHETGRAPSETSGASVSAPRREESTALRQDPTPVTIKVDWVKPQGLREPHKGRFKQFFWRHVAPAIKPCVAGATQRPIGWKTLRLQLNEKGMLDEFWIPGMGQATNGCIRRTVLERMRALDFPGQPSMRVRLKIIWPRQPE